MKKITLFIGLNDKDTKTQIFETSEAVKLLSDEIVKTLGIGTVSAASGIYTHDNGDIVNENTLRVEFYTDDVNAVKNFATWAKDILNQETILFEVTAPEVLFI